MAKKWTVCFSIQDDTGKWVPTINPQEEILYLDSKEEALALANEAPILVWIIGTNGGNIEDPNNILEYDGPYGNIIGAADDLEVLLETFFDGEEAIPVPPKGSLMN